MNSNNIVRRTRSSSQPRDHIFETVKTTEPILYKERWHLNWLLNLSLDDSLVHLQQSSQTDKHAQRQMAVETTDLAGRIDLRICSIDTNHSSRENIDATIAKVDFKSSVMKSPTRSNVLAIWAVRDLQVNLDARLAIMQAVDDSCEITIRSLSKVLDVDPVTAAKFVLALAFQSLLLIDLDRPVCFESSVRMTKFSQYSNWSHSSNTCCPPIRKE